MAGVLKGLLAFDNATAHSYTELLVRYRTSFHNYSVGMHYGSNLFKYLDRHWINTNHCETGVSPKEGVSTAVWCAVIACDVIVGGLGVAPRAQGVAFASTSLPAAGALFFFLYQEDHRNGSRAGLRFPYGPHSRSSVPPVFPTALLMRLIADRFDS